jgi:uncharacterized protein YerC
VFRVILSGARAQSNAAPDDLFKTIQSLDKRFFDAYNHCDLATISSLAVAAQRWRLAGYPRHQL